MKPVLHLGDGPNYAMLGGSTACWIVWLISAGISNQIGCLAVVNGAHCQTILPLPERCLSRGAIATLDVV